MSTFDQLSTWLEYRSLLSIELPEGNPSTTIPPSKSGRLSENERREYLRGYTMKRPPEHRSIKSERVPNVVMLARLVNDLRFRRMRLGYSQPQLDDVIGTAEGTVAKWETGARLPNAYSLVCWAQALKVELIWQEKTQGKEKG